MNMKSKNLKSLLDSASRLRQIRINIGVSQEKFAEYLDISLSAYKKIESAENGISVNVLKKLHDVFNISSDYILYGEYKDKEHIIQLLDNCSEEDKMEILLRLEHYFVDIKKKTFIKNKVKRE